MIQTLAFYLFAALVIASAVMVIMARNPVHSVLWLILAFFNAAGLMVLVGAEFIAMLLVIVYVGAVAVLFLFVVMMIDINLDRMREGYTRYMPLGIGVAIVLILEIGHVIWFRSQGLPFLTVPEPHPEGYSNTKELGAVIYTEHVYAFELASVVLLLAIVAAITLTMRRRPGLKTQNIAEQVAVRRDDRVSLVKMEPTKESDE